MCGWPLGKLGTLGGPGQSWAVLGRLDRAVGSMGTHGHGIHLARPALHYQHFFVFNSLLLHSPDSGGGDDGL